MRIVFVIGRLERAGAERQMVLTALGLQSKGHVVSIVSLDGPGNLDDDARQLGLDVQILGSYFPGLFWKTISYIEYIRNEKPEIVYAFLPKQHLVTALVKYFTSPAKIVWGIRASKIDWSAYRLRARVFFPVATKLSRWADVFIANSWSGAEYHVSCGYRSSRMKVIPNGIDAEIFYPNPEYRRIIRSDWNMDDAVPVVGMLARFDPMKGNEDFLEIAARVEKIKPEARYVAVGSHSDEQAQQFWRKAFVLEIGDKVSLYNTTSNPEYFLNGIDVLVSPSQTEGFPNTILEALACGTPVVATDVGDTRRILGHISKLAEYGDHQSLANAVVESLSNLEFSAGTKINFVKLAAQYNKNELANRTEKVLREILEGPSENE